MMDVRALMCACGCGGRLCAARCSRISTVRRLAEMRVRVQRSAAMSCAGCGETEADGAIFESADGRCFRCNRPALQIPNAEVKAPPPKRRKCGPSLSKTRSAEEAAAHAIKMREMLAAEKAEVRPDFVVCFPPASATMF